MYFAENWPLVLAAAALGLAVAQMIHPFGLRVHPGVLVFMALLLGLRWLIRRQARKRTRLAGDVPKRPLGISDE